MSKMLINVTVSINVRYPKMIKKREEYIRRKLLKKDFNVLAFTMDKLL